MTIITDAMIRHYNDLVARAEAEILQNIIAHKGVAELDYDEAFGRRVLDAVSDDIVLDTSEGWVLWLDLATPHGFYTAASLRVIASELDKRNKELFANAV